MMNFTFKKFLLLSALLIGGLSLNAKENMRFAVPGSNNFTSITGSKPAPAPDKEWLRINKSFEKHPDAGYNGGLGKDGFVEVFSKRTLNGKYYVNAKDSSMFQMEQGTSAMHYQKNGEWLTIDSRLIKLSNTIFEAPRQTHPVGFDIAKKSAYIKTPAGIIYFNDWTLYGVKGGSANLIASADWTKYTIGDDGIHIDNIFPGIDAEMKVMRGSIKTNFIVRSNEFPAYDHFKFKDVFQDQNNGSLAFSNTDGITVKSAEVDFKSGNKKILHIEKGYAYSAKSGSLAQDLEYNLNANQLFLNVSAAYLNTALTHGRVIIDPLVSVEDTLKLTATTASSMNCGAFTNSCNYTLSMTPPAGATIVKVYDAFSIEAVSPAIRLQAFFGLETNGACGFYYGANPADFLSLLPGTLITPDTIPSSTRSPGYDSITRFVLPCIPGPSCTPAPIVFTLRLWNTYCSATAGCSNIYVRGLGPGLIIKLTGVTFTPQKITRSSTVAVCPGTAVTLSRNATFGVPPYTYNWAPGGLTTASVTVNPTTTTTYTSTITDACGNSSIDTTTISVLPSQVPPTVISPQTICQYDNTPLSVVGSNTDLRWYTTPAGGVVSFIAPVPPVTPGTYTYYVSRSTACGESPRAQIVVTVNAKPAPPTIVSPVGYCQYDTVQLKATGQNLKWYLTPTGGAGQPTFSLNTNYVDSFYYYVSQTINGCESDRARIRVFVNYRPNGVVLASRLSVCEGEIDSFNYFGNSLPDAQYNWSTGGAFLEVLSGQNTQGPLLVRFDSAGLRQVRVQVNNKGCLSEIASQTISVRPNPRLAYVVKPDACQDEIINVSLSSISRGIDSFKYNFAGAQIVYGANSSGPYGITYAAPGNYIISSLAYSRDCPSRLYYDTIKVHPLPDARINVVGNPDICAGDSLLFRASGKADSNTQYYWTPDNFFNSGNIFQAHGVVKKTGYVKLSAVSAYGCTAADSVLIRTRVCCELYFPNAFSPNNDQKNDVFRPVTNGHQTIKTFRVMNRWGQVVFETRGDRVGWDGSYNGRDQDNGTFYYYILYNCNDGGDDIEQKGEVLLIR